MMDLLRGNKTHIGVLAAGLLGIVASFGWLSADTIICIGSFITAWTGVAINAQLNRMTDRIRWTLRTWWKANRESVGFVTAGVLGVVATQGWLSAEWISCLAIIIGTATGVAVKLKANAVERHI